MEIKTYADLKEFCNTLNEDQLQQRPFVQVLDEMSVNIREASVNDVDYFYNEDSEGLLPVTDYDPNDWEGEPLDSDYNTIIPAGTMVWLYDDSFFDEPINPLTL
jgi:hypothetical protein